MADHRDPVCGMTVLPESAEGKATFQGETYYFCSDQCMRNFQSSPTKYVEADRTATSQRDSDDTSAQTEPPYTTKGGFTAPKFGSAGSGGGELEPPFNKG